LSAAQRPLLSSGTLRALRGSANRLNWLLTVTHKKTFTESIIAQLPGSYRFNRFERLLNNGPPSSPRGKVSPFVVLGEKISQPPYILGNFPRIEIVFALIDQKSAVAGQPVTQDKYTDLERLKKLFDNGTLTKEEFEAEKAKLLK
jgi:hypothetical protein